jgi:hypothetical protein
VKIAPTGHAACYDLRTCHPDPNESWPPSTTTSTVALDRNTLADTTAPTPEHPTGRGHGLEENAMCTHTSPCPSADAIDHDAARVIADHSDQGWVLLCNGIVRFDDTGELLPDGRILTPTIPTQRRPLVAA